MSKIAEMLDKIRKPILYTNFTSSELIVTKVLYKNKIQYFEVE